MEKPKDVMTTEKQLNVGVSFHLKKRVELCAELAGMDLKGFVTDALERAYEPFDEIYQEACEIGLGVVARNARRREATALKVEGQR